MTGNLIHSLFSSNGDKKTPDWSGSIASPALVTLDKILRAFQAQHKNKFPATIHGTKYNEEELKAEIKKEIDGVTKDIRHATGITIPTDPPFLSLSFVVSHLHDRHHDFLRHFTLGLCTRNNTNGVAQAGHTYDVIIQQ
jgi:hypothetical protein